MTEGGETADTDLAALCALANNATKTTWMKTEYHHGKMGTAHGIQNQRSLAESFYSRGVSPWIQRNDKRNWIQRNDQT